MLYHHTVAHCQNVSGETVEGRSDVLHAVIIILLIMRSRERGVTRSGGGGAGRRGIF